MIAVDWGRAIGIITAPAISALLLGLTQAARALTRRIRNRRNP